jgi:predicted enzyme related to lactoylglutathione lyase
VTSEEASMSRGIQTILYPVKDLAKAKALFRELTGAEPYMDEPYYVGFSVGGQDIGLDPSGHRQGFTGPIGYWHVGDVHKTLQALLDAGAELHQDVRHVGGGKQIASVKDADGNVIGLLQEG